MTFIVWGERQTHGELYISTNGPYMGGSESYQPIPLRHPTLNLTKKKFLHTGGVRKVVEMEEMQYWVPQY